GRIVTVPFSESLDAASREAAGALRRPIGASFDVADSAAQWVYPSHFDDVKSGDEIIVLGQMKPASEPAPHLGGAAPDSETQSLPAAAFGPLLEREAYRAYLDYLAEREASEPAAAGCGGAGGRGGGRRGGGGGGWGRDGSRADGHGCCEHRPECAKRRRVDHGHAGSASGSRASPSRRAAANRPAATARAAPTR